MLMNGARLIVLIGTYLCPDSFHRGPVWQEQYDALAGLALDVPHSDTR